MGTRSFVIAALSSRRPLLMGRWHAMHALLHDDLGRLVEPGPVPVPGVAMVSLLLADGTGPLYREACRAVRGAHWRPRHPPLSIFSS
jgi:hypothetical protein